MKLNKKQLAKKIYDWEMDNGESFYDYFADGTVEPSSWAFFLLGKGFKEKANELVNEIAINKAMKVSGGFHYISQQELFEIYPEEGEQSQDNALKNINLMAEFLSGTDLYIDRVTKFFNEE